MSTSKPNVECSPFQCYSSPVFDRLPTAFPQRLVSVGVRRSLLYLGFSSSSCLPYPVIVQNLQTSLTIKKYRGFLIHLSSLQFPSKKSLQGVYKFWTIPVVDLNIKDNCFTSQRFNKYLYFVHFFLLLLKFSAGY